MKAASTVVVSAMVAIGVLSDVEPALAELVTQHLWSKTLGAPQTDCASRMAVDGAGNVYIVGDTSGSLFATLQDSTNPFLAKYSSTGDFCWGIQTGFPGYYRTVATDTAGAVYASGNGGLDKYDANGELLWHTWVEGGTESPVLDKWGNIYVCGQANNGNACVSKLDSVGNWIWTSEIPTPRTMAATLVLTSTGCLALRANCYGEVSGEWQQVGYVATFDTTGAVMWSSAIGSSPDFALVQDIAADASGGIYIVGASSQSLVGEAVTEPGFLMKYDSLGNAQWVRRYAFPCGEGTSITIDPSGALCVVGNDVLGHDCLYRYNSHGKQLETIPVIATRNDVYMRDFAFSNNQLYTVGGIYTPSGYDVCVESFRISGIPEPSSIMLLIGGGVSTLALARRRVVRIQNDAIPKSGR